MRDKCKLSKVSKNMKYFFAVQLLEKFANLFQTKISNTSLYMYNLISANDIESYETVSASFF